MEWKSLRIGALPSGTPALWGCEGVSVCVCVCVCVRMCECVRVSECVCEQAYRHSKNKS